METETETREISTCRRRSAERYSWMLRCLCCWARPGILDEGANAFCDTKRFLYVRPSIFVQSFDLITTAIVLTLDERRVEAAARLRARLNIATSD